MNGSVDRNRFACNEIFEKGRVRFAPNSDRKSGHIRVLRVKDRRGVPPVSPKKVLARPRDFLGEIHRHAFWQI